MIHAREILARAFGVAAAPSTCDCACCGRASFAATIERIPSSFTDWGLLWGQSQDPLCAGCARLMAGRPGDQPPPLRTVSVRASEAGLELLDRPALWDAIARPRPTLHVLSWAVGRQRHHWLRAELSTPDRLRIGSDDHTVDYVPERDGELLHAVHALLRSPSGTAPILSRSAIQSGGYHPTALERFGIARWRSLEDVVARYRPSPLLDLVTHCCPLLVEPAPPIEEDMMIDRHDALAARLLGAIAKDSRYRIQHGIAFWGGFFRHRVERFRRLSLATMVSRLTDACEGDGVVAARMLLAMSAEDADGVATAIRERPALIVALSRDPESLPCAQS